VKIRLLDIASARSGDKNNICNIGVMAKDADTYSFLKKNRVEYGSNDLIDNNIIYENRSNKERSI
jgi:hypothetical protein